MAESSVEELMTVDAARAGGPHELYLDLMLKCLTRYAEGDVFLGEPHRREKSVEDLEVGLESHHEAETMIGPTRLRAFRQAIESVVRNDVPGDIIETGVWRGGATIYARAVLAALMVTDRTVWVADSFAGLPSPNMKSFPVDEGDVHYLADELRVSLSDVEASFRKYGLLDSQVRFLKGFFSDTLPSAPIEQIAVMRLDGDMYESTYVALNSLYPKLSVGGYCIIDDYGALRRCRQAVDDFRAQHGIMEPMEQTDWTEMRWRRER